MDEITVTTLDVRMHALELALEARDDGEADKQTIARARAFYDFLLEVAATPAPKTKTGGGPVVPFKGKDH